MRLAAICLFATLSVLPAAAPAQGDDSRAADSAAWADSLSKIEARLRYQQGRLELGDGLATLDVPAGFRYLDPKQAKLVLEDAWGNPPGSSTLGMLFPSDVSPLSPEGWGVVISFEEDGYVKDDDAATIDYAKLLREMQESTRDENRARSKHGYPKIELVGWAAPPRYDSATHKLVWAKELAFEGAEEHTLNYDVRVLGRRGVLSLNAVASMGQLDAIQERMVEVMGFTEFNDGHRYADFKPGADKVAAYGIGALIAGKAAAKAGVFKIVLAALASAKKLVALVLIAFAGLAKKLLGRKKDPGAQPA